MKYLAILSILTLQCFALENTSNTPKNTSVECKIKKTIVTTEELAFILKKTDEIYEKDKSSHGKYYELAQTAKEAIATPSYQTNLKNIFSVSQIKDLLQDMLRTCEKYSDRFINLQKIKSEINTLIIEDDMFTNFMLLLFGGKLSDNNLYSENEIFENCIETSLKFMIIDDICDKMAVRKDPIYLATALKSKNNLIKICSNSKNDFLKKVASNLNKPISLDAEDKTLSPVVVNDFDSLDTLDSEVEKILASFQHAWSKEITTLLLAYRLDADLLD